MKAFLNMSLCGGRSSKSGISLAFFRVGPGQAGTNQEFA
jgi:hypothetical protein